MPMLLLNISKINSSVTTIDVTDTGGDLYGTNVMPSKSGILFFVSVSVMFPQ